MNTYYYAYLNEDDICIAIYPMPAPISGTQYIAIASDDQTLIGQHFNRSTSEFEVVYYYAVLNSKNVVESVAYYTTQQTASDTLIAITFAQYQTVVGMYWNGTEFTEPPISSLAKANTNEVSYKDEEKWLSTKLDEMDFAIADNAEDISTLTTAINGKANASHTHTAADITGVVKTVNGSAPDENGNIAVSVSGGGMTASEVLEAVKTVDGSGSGLDADTLDGNDASYFASVTALNGKADASHNHDAIYAPLTHTHEGYAPTEHTHNGYAPTEHTHDGYATTASVTALETAVDDVETLLGDKADSDHTHSEYITAATYAAGMSNKADADHTHSGYATSNHSHSGYASSSHTHSDYLSASGGTVSGNLNVTGIVRVNGQQALYDSGTMVTLSTNNRQTMIAGSAIYSKTTISVSSDERLKENIKSAETNELVELVKNIDVKTFDYIDGEKDCIGVIAQEVVEKNPDFAKYLVREDENGYYSVKTADLVFPLIATVQKLTKEVDELKK